MAWTRGCKIGKGSTAVVSTAIHGGEILAVKSSKLSKSQFLQREKEILSKLSSPYVVGYKGFDVTKERNELYYNLFMEYVAGGTLADEIRRRGGRLDEQSIREYTCRILRGADYLHSNGVAHCDIKCGNILISDQQGLKLADFGCSKTAASNDVGLVSGTPIYMAPEAARGDAQGCEADVWAIACTVIEMATGGLPWSGCGSDPVQVLYRIGFSDQFPTFPAWLSEQGKDFLRRCLVRDPKQRWTVKELLSHPFVEKIESFAKPNSISPTSVLLDHQLWSNSDDEEPQTDEMEMGCSEEVRRDERIEEMAGVSGRPDWSWSEEDWIQVRSESGSISEINSECLVEEGTERCADDDDDNELGLGLGLGDGVMDDLGTFCGGRYDCWSLIML